MFLSSKKIIVLAFCYAKCNTIVTKPPFVLRTSVRRTMRPIGDCAFGTMDPRSIAAKLPWVHFAMHNAYAVDIMILRTILTKPPCFYLLHFYEIKMCQKQQKQIKRIFTLLLLIEYTFLSN